MRVRARFNGTVTPQPPPNSFYDERMSLCLTLAIPEGHAYDVGTLCQQLHGRLEVVSGGPRPVPAKRWWRHLWPWGVRPASFASLSDLLECEDLDWVWEDVDEWVRAPFTHLTVEVPREDHAPESAAKAEAGLARELRSELGDYVAPGREFRVRYARGLDLPKGRIRLCFGYGLYLPARAAVAADRGGPAEQPVGAVEAAPPSGGFTPLLLPDSDPAAWYPPHQHWLAIGAGRERAAVRLPPSCAEAAESLGDSLLVVDFRKRGGDPERVRLVPPIKNLLIQATAQDDGSWVHEVKHLEASVLRLRVADPAAAVTAGRDDAPRLTAVAVLLPRPWRQPIIGRGGETIRLEAYELQLTADGRPSAFLANEHGRLRLRAAADRQRLEAWEPGQPAAREAEPGQMLCREVRLLPPVDHLRDLARLEPAAPFAVLPVPAGEGLALGAGGTTPSWLDACARLEPTAPLSEVGLAGRRLTVRRTPEGHGLLLSGTGPDLPARSAGQTGGRWDQIPLQAEHPFRLAAGDEFLLGPFVLRCEGGSGGGGERVGGATRP